MEAVETQEPQEPLEKDPHTGRPLSLPGLSLEAALRVARPEEKAFGLAVRLAVSVPNADLIAVQINEGRPRVRRVNRITGQGASQMDTGEWLEAAEVLGVWRPA